MYQLKDASGTCTPMNPEVAFLKHEVAKMLSVHHNTITAWDAIAFFRIPHYRKCYEVQPGKYNRRMPLAKYQVQAYMWGPPPAKNIGMTTRLFAVDVPAQPVEGEQRLGKPIKNLMDDAPTEKPVELPAPGLTFNQSFESAQPIPVDIAMLMAKVPKSTIVAASPRVGKGVVVTVAIANLKQLHPDLEIWLIDPKNEPTELHYWALIDPDKRCHFDLRDLELDLEKVTKLFEALLIQFNRSKASRKLLIIDEFVMLNQKCTRGFTDKLKDFIVGICSSGETSPDQGIGRFVWIITQSPYVTDIGFKTKAALATFQRVFLLNTSSLQLYSLAASASFVPSGQDKEVADLLEVTLSTSSSLVVSELSGRKSLQIGRVDIAFIAHGFT